MTKSAKEWRLKELTEEDVTKLRERMEYEDQLLNSRTTIVLVFSGLMASAMSLTPGWGGLALAGLTLLLNVLWLPCAKRHGRFSRLLSDEIRARPMLAPIDEQLRFDLSPRSWLTATAYMCWMVPAILTMFWLVWAIVRIVGIVKPKVLSFMWE